MKAIIIGGGIGGLAAGIALQQSGVPVEVFERVVEPGEVGAGLTLWANAVKALEQIGMAEIVRSFSNPELQGGIYSWRGDLLMSMSSQELEQRYGQANLAMHRADLHAALLHQLGAEQVHFGMECVGFEQTGTGVTAHFKDGSSVRGELLIGADGIHSVIRAQLHGAQKPTYAGYTAWRAVVPFDLDRLVPGETWGPGSRFGQVPLHDGRVYWFATKNAPEGARSPEGEKSELLRTFEGLPAPIEELIRASDEAAILRNDIYDRPVLRSWGTGCVTLLGDAAHPMTPNLGQGAGQALEDVVVLMKSLRVTPDVEAALRAYETRRIPRTSFPVKQSRQVGQIGQWEHPLAVRARDYLVKYLVPRLQERQLARILAYEV